jgi:hypothetical protein
MTRSWQLRSPSPKKEYCLCNKYFEFVVFINDDPFSKKKLLGAFSGDDNNDDSSEE